MYIVSIPRVKAQIAKACQDFGYANFSVEKPELGKNVILEFSVEDPKESVDVLCKTIEKNLINTNWCLEINSVSYRLPYITGKLITYEGDEE
jgi:hypothetical protein